MDKKKAIKNGLLVAGGCALGVAGTVLYCKKIGMFLPEWAKGVRLIDRLHRGSGCYVANPSKGELTLGDLGKASAGILEYYQECGLDYKPEDEVVGMAISVLRGTR